MKKSQPTFSPQQEKMFVRLGNYVQFYEVLRIEKDTLIECLKISNKKLNTAIYRLNKQFKQKYQTKRNLIKCVDKINGYYDIADAWNLLKKKQNTAW